MENHYESHYGKSLWKTTMEDHYGRPALITMEDHYGRPLWKTTMEDHYGRPLWKTTMENHYGEHYGRPLCKTTMMDAFGNCMGQAVKSVQESYPDLLGSGPSGTHWSPRIASHYQNLMLILFS